MEMERRRSMSLFLSVLITTVGFALARAEGERLNKSAPTSIWSGTKDDEYDGLREGDGGFSSLDSMLQWAIGHSDPEKVERSCARHPWPFF